MEDKTMELTT